MKIYDIDIKKRAEFYSWVSEFYKNIDFNHPYPETDIEASNGFTIKVNLFNVSVNYLLPELLQAKKINDRESAISLIQDFIDEVKK